MPAMASFVLWPDFVNSAYARDGKVWAATDGGLGISSNSGTTFVNCITADGLGLPIIYGVY
jgi:hypothetical protein